jgi:hypothetical protein
MGMGDGKYQKGTASVRPEDPEVMEAVKNCR